jgi:hypothetical protein
MSHCSLILCFFQRLSGLHSCNLSRLFLLALSLFIFEIVSSSSRPLWFPLDKRSQSSLFLRSCFIVEMISPICLLSFQRVSNLITSLVYQEYFDAFKLISLSHLSPEFVYLSSRLSNIFYWFCGIYFVSPIFCVYVAVLISTFPQEFLWFGGLLSQFMLRTIDINWGDL